MSALRWCLLFVMLAGACVAVESRAQPREASREDSGTHPGAYSGPGSFSDASIRFGGGPSRARLAVKEPWSASG
jgi:hypothetical protein